MHLSFVLLFYLLRRITLSFCGVSIVTTAIIFILDTADILRRTSELPTIKWSIVFRIVLLKIPYVYCQILPFILLFSALLCLWMLSRKNEITVLKAGGASFRQILLPLLLFNTLISFIDIGILNPVSRFLWSRHLAMDSRHLQQQDQQFLVSENGIWMRSVEKHTPKIYRIDRLNRDTGELINISIFIFEPKGFLLETQYDAQSAFLTPHKTIRLNRVWVMRKEGTPHFHETLEIPTHLSKKDLEDRYLNPRSLSVGKILDVIQLLKKSGLKYDEYQLHLHTEIARIFWLISVVLIAGVFMMRPPRESKSYQLASSALFVTFILYILKDFLYALGLSGRLPFYLAAWAPVALNYMIPIALLIHYEDN